MLQATRHIDGRVLWANLLLLFWLSLVPFVIRWMDEAHFAALPTAAYGVVGLIVLIAALTIGTTPYWRFSMLLSASIVMLLAPDASSAINGVGGQRLWGTCIGAAVVASVVWLAGRRATNLSTGARNITP